MKGSGPTALGTAAVAACLAVACSPPRGARSEEPPAPVVTPSAEAPPVRARNVPPPAPDELRSVVSRVFGDAARGDEGDGLLFLVGDFNGDLSQDVAVVVRAAPGRLDAMNAPYPRWMLKDPLVPPGEDTKPLRVKAGEALLAIVHGHGPEGWRSAEATQTYLLKNAVGTGMKVHGGTEFVDAHRDRNLPRIQGDLIGQVLHGTDGYLYYAGPTYSWYDARTFTGEPQRRLVHGRTEKRR